jgi:hypothetical protein
MTQSIAPPTRKLVNSAKRFPRSARTPIALQFLRLPITFHLLYPFDPWLNVFSFNNPSSCLTHAIHRARAERQHEIARLHVLAQSRCSVIEGPM